MKAIIIRSHGGPDVLQLAERPVPRPGRGQVLVRVRAASVNPRDWLVREGKYVFNFALPALPFVIGSDFAGEVVEAGPGVTAFRVADQVFGMQPLRGGMGAYAEYVAIDAGAIALKPRDIGFEEAAAVPCAGLTAWGALARIGRVAPGSSVAINGASGGVGTYAVQIAKALGAKVTAITSTANAALVTGLGADEVVDYKSCDPLAAIRGADVFFDAIGRTDFGRARACLRRGGRYVTTIPGAAAAFTALSTGAARLARLGDGKSSHMVLVRAWGEDLAALGGLMAAGKLRSVIEQSYPLAEAAQAHVRSRSWRVRGKLVLRVD